VGSGTAAGGQLRLSTYFSRGLRVQVTDAAIGNAVFDRVDHSGVLLIDPQSKQGGGFGGGG